MTEVEREVGRVNVDVNCSGDCCSMSSSWSSGGGVGTGEKNASPSSSSESTTSVIVLANVCWGGTNELLG